MKKYQVMRLVKVNMPFTNKVVLRKENVYPYRMYKLGHAMACARMLNSQVMYTDPHNKVVNFIVQDGLQNIVFVARTNIDGICGNELGDLEM